MFNIGAGDDGVELTIDGQTLKIWKSYEIKSSVLTQPATFSLKCGSSQTVKEIMAIAKPRSRFELRIGGELLHVGLLGGPKVSNRSGTEVTLRGRDLLAPLHDGFVSCDRSFNGTTPRKLIRALLDDAGLKHIELTTRGNARVDKPIANPGGVKAGGRRYEYAKKQLDKVGLFLWGDAGGKFVLSEPDSAQPPTYRIECPPEGQRGDPFVEYFDFDNDTEKRFARYLVHGKGGIPKSGVVKSQGAWVDEEMTALGYEIEKVIKDTSCKSRADAEYLARRIAAETNRAAWKLSYTVAGHTAPSLTGGSRITWRPDRTVDVIHEEIDIIRLLYLESCTYAENSGTTTTLTLMRPDHMIFATDRET